jgi:DNA mismatch endonuclease, patch repair protein
MRATPSYVGLRPASSKAISSAHGSSGKRDTKCELALRSALHRRGLRYRVALANLPGCPDIAFLKDLVAVFCDGDFWHGRNLAARIARLSKAHNAPYWVAKIQTNVARDARNNAALQGQGWTVLRLWETDILASPETAASQVEATLREARQRVRAQSR